MEKNILSYAEQIEGEFIRLFELYARGTKDREKMDIIDSFFPEIGKKVLQLPPDAARVNGCKSKIPPHDVAQVEEVTRLYINLCRRFGGTVKLLSICELFGYHLQTVLNWHEKNAGGEGYILSLNDEEIKKENVIIIDRFSVSDNTTNNSIYNYNINKSMFNNLCNDKQAKKLSSFRFDIYKMIKQAIRAQNDNGLSASPMGQVVRANNDEEVGKLYEPRNIGIKATTAAAALVSREALGIGTTSVENAPELPQF